MLAERGTREPVIFFTLREVLVHARTFEAERTTPEEGGAGPKTPAHRFRRLMKSRVSTRWGWAGEKAARIGATRLEGVKTETIEAKHYHFRS